MLTKNVNALYGGSPQTYASELATRITVTSTSVPTICVIPMLRSVGYIGTTLACVRAYAHRLFNSTMGQDLCNSPYFNNAIPVVRLLLPCALNAVYIPEGWHPLALKIHNNTPRDLASCLAVIVLVIAPST
ncbi:hypothetical protein BC826DRAFT_1040228 [Russula brevipes]|nr:hypothetical protein BC826DRAFT_1040228 [Russula brevipes]